MSISETASTKKFQRASFDFSPRSPDLLMSGCGMPTSLDRVKG